MLKDSNRLVSDIRYDANYSGGALEVSGLEKGTIRVACVITVAVLLQSWPIRSSMTL